MIKFSQARGKTIGVLGLGVTGLSLVASCQDAKKIIVWERSPRKFEDLQKQFHGPAKLELAADDIISSDVVKHLDYLAVSPGIPLHGEQAHPAYKAALKQGIPIISDLEILRLENPQAKFIGITGTNGKSTTTALAAHALMVAGIDHQLGGNIGTPVLELENNASVYLLEVSSFQLELLQKPHFNCAVLLNITPDHLDRHLSMQGYCQAKERIFAGQGKGDMAVVSVDDEYSIEIYQTLVKKKGQVVSVSVENHEASIWCKDRDLHYNDRVLQVPENPSLMGQHNMQNVMAVFAIAQYVKMDEKDFLSALKSFKGLPHRMELVAKRHDLIFIDDSKATNTDAAAKALATFDNIYLIAGGISKDSGIIDLQEYFPKLKMVYLIGQAAESFAEVLYLHHVPHIIAGDMATAIKHFRDLAVTEGTVLLAPACASFDQFSSYKERGKLFKQLVAKLLL
jgi:UDP-N-acetylmuramoylalanine--D-glutamate ligase